MPEFHDVKIRADLAFVDCHRALAELEVLLPHLDADYLKRLFAEADDLHERVTQFAEAVKSHASPEVVEVPTRRLEVVR